VEVYLEGGFRPLEGTEAVASTNVEATGTVLRVVRNGAVSLYPHREHVTDVLGLGEIPMAEPEEAVPAAPAAPAAPSEAEPAAADHGTPDVRTTAAPAEKDPEA
jgi:hypothetical protein